MRETSPSFLIVSRPGKINQDTTHEARTNGVEVSPVLPVDGVCVHQSEINLMYKSCGLKGMARLLPRHVPTGQPMKLVINERHKMAQSCLVARFPGQQQTRNVVCRDRPIFVQFLGH